MIAIIFLTIPLFLIIFYYLIKNNEYVNSEIFTTKNDISNILDKKSKTSPDKQKLVFELGRYQELQRLDKNYVFNTLYVALETNNFGSIRNILKTY